MKTFFFGGKNGCGKGSCLELFLMKALRIRTGKYDEESGIFLDFLQKKLQFKT